MKRTFLAKRNALLSSANFSWGAVALGFAVLVLFMRLLAPNLFLQAFAPAFRLADAIAEKGRTFSGSFSDAAALAAANERLLRENAALASENLALSANRAAQEALGAAAGILAGVAARPPESPYDTLILAAGSAAGVSVGMEAFGEGGVPLGAVSAVTEDFSRIILFSAPGAVTHGWIGPAHIPLSIFGAGGGGMHASLSRSAEVAVGDVVFAPGPGMLPIGIVARIDSDPSAPDIILRIRPNTNPFSVTWVLLRDTGSALRNAFSTASSTPL